MWYRPARVRARRRRALTAIPEAGQFVLSARFVMPAVVLSIHHCIAATNTTTTTTTATTTKKPSPSAAAAAVTIAAAAAAVTAGNNSTTTTLYWLPVLDSPACFYCGGRLFVIGGATTSTTTGNHTTGIGSNSSCSSSSSSSGVNNCYDACSLPSRNFGRLCRCDGAVVLLVPYVLGPPPCFRPFVLPPAFVAAAANHLRYHRRIHHLLYNTAVVGNNMETR